MKYKIETPSSFTKALKRCIKRGLKYELLYGDKTNKEAR